MYISISIYSFIFHRDNWNICQNARMYAWKFIVNITIGHRRSKVVGKRVKGKQAERRNEEEETEKKNRSY